MTHVRACGKDCPAGEAGEADVPVGEWMGPVVLSETRAPSREAVCQREGCGHAVDDHRTVPDAEPKSCWECIDCTGFVAP